MGTMQRWVKFAEPIRLPVDLIGPESLVKSYRRAPRPQIAYPIGYQGRVSL